MTREHHGSAGHADPLDGPPPLLRSYKVRLGAIILAVAGLTALLTWLSVRVGLHPALAIPAVIVGALMLTQVLARGTTSPLRQITAAARAMSAGDYSQRVHLGRPREDEIGQLGAAFSAMAATIERNDRSQRELVATVSHELRTPVTGLRAQLENMADGVVEPTPERLEAVLEDTERLSQLIEHLLDLSRLDAGAAQLERTEVALRPFLERVTAGAALAAQARHREVAWSIDVEPEDLTMDADEARMQQVLTNLLDNASRHSPAGGTVHVVACQEPAAGSRRGAPRPGHGRAVGVRIEVIDDGPGIPLADGERLFERFQRGAPSASGGSDTGTGGTGLGLAIARWAVSLHGGTIAVVPPPPGHDTRRSSRIRVSIPTPEGLKERSPLSSRLG